MRACADAVALNLARGLQGIGGALLVPSSLAILTASFDPSERGRAVGLWASLSGIGAVIGPLAGGLLVDAISWRGIFFLNLPIAVLVWLVALPHVPESRDETAERHLDLPGAAIAIVFLQRSDLRPDRRLELRVDLAARRRRPPGRRPRVASRSCSSNAGPASPWCRCRSFPQPDVLGVNAATLVIYFALAGTTLYLVLDLQQARGFSAVGGRGRASSP